VYRHPEITLLIDPVPASLLPAFPNIIIKSQNTTPPSAPHLRIRLVLHLDQPQGSNAACGIRLLALPIPRMGNRCRTIFFFSFQIQEKKKGGSVGVMSGLACVRSIPRLFGRDQIAVSIDYMGHCSTVTLGRYAAGNCRCFLLFEMGNRP
jgi:hypothetical protein